MTGTEDTATPGSDAPAVTPGPGLDRALVRGLAWTGAARWTVQLVTWLATIVVARLLARNDFGIWTSAGVYLGIVTLLSEFGIGASIVMIRDLTGEQVAQVNGFAVLTGLSGTVLSWIVARPMAWFYDTPEIAGVIAAMSVLFLISAFRIVPHALLQRDLRFKQLAFVDAARAVIQAVVLVVTAALGFRYWTLVIGALTGEIAWTLMILGRRTSPLAWPRLASIRKAVSFSTDVVVGRLSWYLYSNSDFLVAGRRLGQDALGAYGLAWSLASVPVEKVSSIVNNVTPAFFSAVQSDARELRRYLLSLTQGISLLAFPAGIGLALVADSFVPAILGPKWLPAVGPLQLLAFYSTVRAIGPILTPVLNAIGETRFAAVNNVAALLIMPVAFVVGSRWGTTGIAACWLVVHPTILAALYLRVSSRIALRVGDYLGSLWPAASSVALMTVAVLGVRVLGPHDWHPVPRLAAEVATGGAVYSLMLLLFHRSRVGAFLRILRLARQGPPTPSSRG